MTSDRKIIANRGNAAKSTGPKSLRGKSLSRLNAAKHGLYSSTRLLPGEDHAHYRALATAITDYFKPLGPVEETLTDQIIGEAWRLKRNGRAEYGLFERFHEGRTLRILKGEKSTDQAKLEPAGNEIGLSLGNMLMAETKLEKIQNWDLTLLEAMLPGDEREPYARIERQRRATMHSYLTYVATLRALQDERRILDPLRPDAAIGGNEYRT
jgi:hypothetical protein